MRLSVVVGASDISEVEAALGGSGTELLFDPSGVPPIRLWAAPLAAGAGAIACLWVGGQGIGETSAIRAQRVRTEGSLREARISVGPASGGNQADWAERGEQTMNAKTQMIAAIAGTMMSSGVVQGQDAVQWRVEDGGNGHWYANVQTNTVIGWGDSKAAAERQGGYLACPSTSPENDWVWVNVVAPTYTGWDGWIGLVQASGPEPSGGWRWITGEAATYFAWCGFQPDNSGPEHFGNYHGSPKCWNDMAENGCYFGKCLVKSYIVEWSADCNNNGIVDFGEIREGLLPDINGNNIPDCCESAAACCPADLNDDGQVNGPDLGALVAFWGPNPSYDRADITGDGTVNGSDIAALLSAWGPCPG